MNESHSLSIEIWHELLLMLFIVNFRSYFVQSDVVIKRQAIFNQFVMLIIITLMITSKYAIMFSNCQFATKRNRLLYVNVASWNHCWTTEFHHLRCFYKVKANLTLSQRV